MGAQRESKPMERALDRLISEMRSLDKLLWSYSGTNIAKADYPLSRFRDIEDAVEDFDVWYNQFKKEYLIEYKKVLKLNEDKFPNTKKDEPPVAPPSLDEVFKSGIFGGKT